MNRIFLFSHANQSETSIYGMIKANFRDWLVTDKPDSELLYSLQEKGTSIALMATPQPGAEVDSNMHNLLVQAREAGFTIIYLSDNDSTIPSGCHFDLVLSTSLGEEAISGILHSIAGISDERLPVPVLTTDFNFGNLLHLLPGIVFVRESDAGFTTTFLSDVFQGVTGFDKDDFILNRKKSYFDLVPSPDYENLLKTLHDSLSKSKSYQVEYKIQCADGALRWISERGRPVVSRDGDEIRLEGIMMDITEMKLAEEEISRLLQAVEQNPHPVVFTNPDGIVVYANHGITEVTGFRPSEITGTLINLLNSEKNDPEMVGSVFNALQKGSDWQGEFYNWKKNGQRYWEKAFLSPIRDESGKITHFTYIIEDITKRKHIEKVLVEAKDKAEKSDKLKTAFLTNMSHEIRIPMNAIIGFTEMLLEKDYSEEEKGKFIELVLENGRKLLSTIDDVIDIAKIEAGQMNISTQRCSANKILFDNFYIFRQMSQKLGKSHLDLRAVQFVEDENLLFISDPQRINQVMSNLMSNALKYTHEGFIELGYRLTDFRDTKYLEFYVKDSGTGIPSYQAEQIFDRFKRIDNNQKSGFGGSGLGLAISRNIARLMGGDLMLDTELDKGSTFRFLIPYYEIKPDLITPPAVEAKRDDKPDWSDRYVLIAEDEDSNFKLLEIMLRKTNVKVVRAYNGKQACDYVTGGRPVDLILMDVKMPVMDGYEATARIKDMKPELPVVVQTAFALAGDRQTSIDAGCDDYLSKPIKATELYGILKKYLD